MTAWKSAKLCRQTPTLTTMRWFFPLLFLFCEAAMAVEEPRYTVLVSDPPFEVRRYAAFTVAQTQIQGDFDAASRSGFRRIASYIFGDNLQAGLGAQRKISMTAPVTVTPESEGWRVHFVMPSAETVQSLPRPLNPQIQLRSVPEHDAVAVRFGGFTTQASIQEQTERLMAWAQARQLKLSPTAQIARYDDPFTLPWNRRNEILIDLMP
jgi:SOUL heme-binding protein